MKKVKLLVALGVCGLVLGACGNEEKAEGNATETVSTAVESSEIASSALDSSKTSESAAKSKDVYFENDTLKIDMATVKLTGTEITPPNEFNEASQLVITYEFTNDSEELMQPGMTFIACFNASQETEVTVDALDVGMSPQDEKYTAMNEMAFTDVKPGATVESVISYDIKYDGDPITLTATQGIAGDELGTKIYETK